MLRKLFLAGMIGSAGFFTMPVMAQQDSAVSQTALPEVKEVSPEAGQSGLMSGEKPFTLMVDENSGELIYDFDEQTKDLKSIKAKVGVIFASEDMTLNSDEMEYTTLNSEIVATGKRVVVRMGEMVITCQYFKYNPETQAGQFEGKPILYQKDKEGKVTTTAGRIISVYNTGGSFQMRVIGGQGTPTYVKSSGNQTGEKKTLAPGEKGASMTLNSNGSSLAAPSAKGTSGSSSSARGGILPMPGVGSSNEKPTTKSSGTSDSKIDPDNSEDVKKLSDPAAQ